MFFNLFYNAGFLLASFFFKLLYADCASILLNDVIFPKAKAGVRGSVPRGRVYLRSVAFCESSLPSSPLPPLSHSHCFWPCYPSLHHHHFCFPLNLPPPFSSHVLQGGRDQSLTFEGRELVDRKTLDQYNIKIGSRLMQQPGICVRAPAPALLLSCSCYKACIHACQHFHDAQ